MLMERYLAARANIGAINIVGNTIRLVSDATTSLVSILSSSLKARKASLGSDTRARFAPRTTRISGTATPPLWRMALVIEFLTNVPSLKKRRCKLGMDATSNANAIAKSGGFMDCQIAPTKVVTPPRIFVKSDCNGDGREAKAVLIRVEVLPKMLANLLLKETAYLFNTVSGRCGRGSSSEGEPILSLDDCLIWWVDTEPSRFPFAGVCKIPWPDLEDGRPVNESCDDTDEVYCRLVTGVCSPDPKPRSGSAGDNPSASFPFLLIERITPLFVVIASSGSIVVTSAINGSYSPPIVSIPCPWPLSTSEPTCSPSMFSPADFWSKTLRPQLHLSICPSCWNIRRYKIPRAATSSSLSPGIWSQCSPFMVWDKERTNEMGKEFELPKTFASLVGVGL